MSVKTIKADSLSKRILLIVLGLLCLICVFFVTKWFLGNSISNRVFQKEVARFAVTLAPGDPQTHFALGKLYEDSFLPEDLPKALAEYQQAVALSPYDYRLWLAYGKAKERNGDPAGAEKALLKALELAPNYAEVQWTYGNILLRQNKTTEAFVAIRKAVENDAKFAAPAATTAWDIFGGDIVNVKKAIGNSAPVQSALATFLAGQKRFNEAIEIWNSLPEKARKTTFQKDGQNIFNQLIAEKKYRSALQIRSQLAEENDKEITLGKVTNGGFEAAINSDKTETFEWEIANGNQPKIGINVEEKHSGEKSLTFVFNSPMGKEFRPVSQIIAVEGGVKYEFEAFYKANLETTTTLKWEIVDVSSGKVLASTGLVEKKTDWKSLRASFITPEESEGVLIRLVRANCTAADCSISGTVWFDDISLN